MKILKLSLISLAMILISYGVFETSKELRAQAGSQTFYDARPIAAWMFPIWPANQPGVWVSDFSGGSLGALFQRDTLSNPSLTFFSLISNIGRKMRLTTTSTINYYGRSYAGGEIQSMKAYGADELSYQDLRQTYVRTYDEGNSLFILGNRTFTVINPTITEVHLDHVVLQGSTNIGAERVSYWIDLYFLPDPTRTIYASFLATAHNQEHTSAIIVASYDPNSGLVYNAPGGIIPVRTLWIRRFGVGGAQLSYLVVLPSATP